MPADGAGNVEGDSSLLALNQPAAENNMEFSQNSFDVQNAKNNGGLNTVQGEAEYI